MKKFLTFILVLAMVMSVSSFALAANVLPSADANGLITLTEDTYELDAAFEVTTGQDITIDLNGKSITPSSSIAGDSLIIVHHGGKLTIKDSAGNGMINSGDLCAIKMTVKQPDQNPPVAELVIESGTVKSEDWFAITGNGSRTSDNYRANTKITINGGSVISTNGHAIFHPQDGELNVKGGTIKGETGIEMRAGTLNVTGGTIIATHAFENPSSNGSGTTTNGVAVSVSQHTTNCPIDVNISGGTLKAENASAKALYITDEEATPAGSTPAEVDVDVTGGKVEGPVEVQEDTNGVPKASLVSEEIISGGTFTDDSAKQYMVAGAPNYTDDNGNIVMGEKPVTGNGISVKYNGGNSFSTSNPSVPTGVEIDGVPVTFNGTGSNFTVGCISSDAKWVTVRWNSTTVTTNFTPDGLVECTTVSIPKTGDMSIWAAIAQFLGF